MIEIKRRNYVTGGEFTPHILADVVRFLELDGRNPLLICSDHSSIGSFLKNNFIFNSFDSFKEIISNKSNLFRYSLVSL